MRRSQKLEASMHAAPPRPPKPKNLRVNEVEPLYETTLPLNRITPPLSPKPKGILKNSTPLPPKGRRARSASAPNCKINEHVSLRTEDIGHFDLNIKEPENVLTNEENFTPPDVSDEHRTEKPSKKFRPNFSTGSRKKKAAIKAHKEEYRTALKSRILNETMLPNDTYLKAVHAAKVESLSGIMHLIVIISSIITLAVMAKLTNDWEIKIRRCPLYVQTFEHEGTYWGNDNMASCHYAAYMPALVLIMSFSLIMFHGGILISWRNGTQAYKLMLSKTYAKVIFFIELLEMAIAISIACVISDGVRQTCLSFQLNPWMDERPDHCKEGYDDRDDLFGLSKTYSRLLTGIVTSIVSSAMLITTSILYLIRINPCCRAR